MKLESGQFEAVVTSFMGSLASAWNRSRLAVHTFKTEKKRRCILDKDPSQPRYDLIHASKKGGSHAAYIVSFVPCCAQNGYDFFSPAVQYIGTIAHSRLFG